MNSWNELVELNYFSLFLTVLMNQQLCLQVLVYVKRMKIISLICLVIEVPNSSGASASLILYLFITHLFIQISGLFLKELTKDPWTRL